MSRSTNIALALLLGTALLFVAVRAASTEEEEHQANMAAVPTDPSAFGDIINPYATFDSFDKQMQQAPEPMAAPSGDMQDADGHHAKHRFAAKSKKSKKSSKKSSKKKSSKKSKKSKKKSGKAGDVTPVLKHDKKEGVITVHIKLPKAPPAPTLDPNLFKSLMQPSVENTTVVTTTITTKTPGGKGAKGAKGAKAPKEEAPAAEEEPAKKPKAVSTSFSGSASSPGMTVKGTTKIIHHASKLPKLPKLPKIKPPKKHKKKKNKCGPMCDGAEIDSSPVTVVKSCRSKKRCVRQCNRCQSGCPDDCEGFCSRAFKCLDRKMKPFLQKRKRLIQRLTNRILSKEEEVSKETEWISSAKRIIKDLSRKSKNVKSHLKVHLKEVSAIRAKLEKIKKQFKTLVDTDDESDILRFLQAKLQKMLIKSAMLEGRIKSMNSKRALYKQQIRKATAELKKRTPSA